MRAWNGDPEDDDPEGDAFYEQAEREDRLEHPERYNETSGSGWEWIEPSDEDARAEQAYERWKEERWGEE